MMFLLTLLTLLAIIVLLLPFNSIAVSIVPDAIDLRFTRFQHTARFVLSHPSHPLSFLPTFPFPPTHPIPSSTRLPLASHLLIAYHTHTNRRRFAPFHHG